MKIIAAPINVRLSGITLNITMSTITLYINPIYCKIISLSGLYSTNALV